METALAITVFDCLSLVVIANVNKCYCYVHPFHCKMTFMHSDGRVNKSIFHKLIKCQYTTSILYEKKSRCYIATVSIDEQYG